MLCVLSWENPSVVLIWDESFARGRYILIKDWYVMSEKFPFYIDLRYACIMFNSFQFCRQNPVHLHNTWQYFGQHRTVSKAFLRNLWYWYLKGCLFFWCFAITLYFCLVRFYSFLINVKCHVQWDNYGLMVVHSVSRAQYINFFCSMPYINHNKIFWFDA